VWQFVLKTSVPLPFRLFNAHIHFRLFKMGLVRTLNGVTPELGKGCFIAETATLIGRVKAGDNCSFWYGAVLRGDVCDLILGDRVNIQDGAVVHGTYEKSVTRIGNDVTVGHNAIVHGCVLQDNVLIGMGAIVMDDAVVPSGTIVAAGAVVLEKQILEPNSIYAGTPAKKVKALDPNTSQEMLKGIASKYVMYSGWYNSGE
jgi:carbonic anhydrase/acetyltransferase-like protein (isoleucine patch superfamily)